MEHAGSKKQAEETVRLMKKHGEVSMNQTDPDLVRMYQWAVLVIKSEKTFLK